MAQDVVAVRIIPGELGDGFVIEQEGAPLVGENHER